MFFLRLTVLRILQEPVFISCEILTRGIFFFRHRFSMRWKAGDSWSAAQTFHDELREGILFNHVIRNRFVFDSAFASPPCDTSNFHMYSTQCLLSNKIDNKSTVLSKWSRIVRSTPRSLCRGSFSSNSRWMRCRRCPALNLPSIHLGEDGSQSDLSTHERVRSLFFPLCCAKALGFWSLGCLRYMLWVSPCLLDHTAHCLFGRVLTCSLDQTRHDSSELRVSPYLLFGFFWIGLVGCCCCLQLHQNSNPSAKYL